ncbi:transcription elongation factor spt5 [Marasmius tenuissimus]|uniref:Transcription elongation factor spt5 n=1 Tax=Marasmius tenuissimus TaxID=585030 RepID=A0ABR2ZNJ1_9AGAR
MSLITLHSEQQTYGFASFHCKRCAIKKVKILRYLKYVGFALTASSQQIQKKNAQQRHKGAMLIAESDSGTSRLGEGSSRRRSDCRQGSYDGLKPSKPPTKQQKLPLQRILDRLEELKNDQNIITQTVDKLAEKVESVRQQSIAARVAAVEKSGTSRRRSRGATRHGGKFVIPKPITHRGDDRNDFLKLIRLFMNPRIGITQDNDIITLDLSRFPSRRDAKRFIDQKSKPPHDRLLICWESLRCPWNEVVSQHFLSAFTNQHPQTELRGERRKRKSSVKTAAINFSLKTKGVYEEGLDRNRVTSVNAQSHPDLRQRGQWALAMTIIERLGVPGMSSDESEDLEDVPERRYTVRARSWRSKRIQELLVRIDRELRKTKRSLYGNAPPGNAPRLRQRVRTPADSRRAAVALLPTNCYHKEWLRRLSTTARGQLCPGDRVELPDLE